MYFCLLSLDENNTFYNIYFEIERAFTLINYIFGTEKYYNHNKKKEYKVLQYSVRGYLKS